MSIVDEQGHGPLFGQRHHDPIEPVKVANRPSAPAAAGATALTTGRAAAAAPDSRLARCIIGHRPHGRLEQLPDRPERKVALQLATDRRVHLHPLRPRSLAVDGEQRRLARSGLTLDHDQTALPGSRVGQRRLKARELGVTLQQRPLPLARRHRCARGYARAAGYRGSPPGLRPSAPCVDLLGGDHVVGADQPVGVDGRLHGTEPRVVLGRPERARVIAVLAEVQVHLRSGPRPSARFSEVIAWAAASSSSRTGVTVTAYIA